MAVTLASDPNNSPIPNIGSVGNSITADVSAMLLSSLPTSVIDINSVNVTITFSALDTQRSVFLAGKIQTNFNGSARVLGSVSGGSDILKLSFSHNDRFFYNSPVTITVTGIELTPVPLPFTVSWSFNTTIFSNIYPNAAIVTGGTVPDNSPVDRNVSFKLNSSITAGVIVPTSLVVSWPSFSEDIIALGPASTFLYGTDITTPGIFGIQFSRKQDNLPYDKTITVLVAGTDNSIPFSQSFIFSTVKSPLTVLELDNLALTSIQNSYTQIKDDGAFAVTTYNGPGLSIDYLGNLTDPNTDFGHDTPVPGDTPDVYAAKTVNLVSNLYPGNNRVTTITRRAPGNAVPNHVLQINTKTVPFTEGPNNIDSYSIINQVVRGAKSIQASSPGLSGMEDQAKSTTNGIFLAVQQWAHGLDAFRHVFTARNLKPTVTTLTGSVSVNNGNATVTGVGTAFLSQLVNGSTVRFGSDLTVYTVQNIASDQSLTLTVVFGGTTASGLQCFRVSTDWASPSPTYENSAIFTFDPSNEGLDVCSFAQAPAANGVGFLLNVPAGASGFSLGITGRPSSLGILPTAYVGFTLYHRSIVSGLPPSAWSPLVLSDLSFTDTFYKVSPAQAMALSSLQQDTLYQFELVRTAPATLPLLEAPASFLLLELLLDFI